MPELGLLGDFHFLRPEWLWGLLPTLALYALARGRTVRIYGEYAGRLPDDHTVRKELLAGWRPEQASESVVAGPGAPRPAA